MESGYDTINLRNEADFLLCISKDLFWVPTNKLGKSRYTNLDLKNIASCYSSQQIRDLKLNLFEAIQLFQIVLQFEESNDIVYFPYDNIKWQLHKSGRFAYETNRGCCASAAAWLNYIIEKTYEHRGYIHYIRPDGSGHIVNYIFYNNYYYIIDMTAMIYENAKYVAIETGNRSDYLGGILYTGILVMTKELQNYINYHRRIPLRKGYKFSYLVHPPTYALPPSCARNVNGIVHYCECGQSKLLQINDFLYERREILRKNKIPIEYTDNYY